MQLAIRTSLRLPRVATERPHQLVTVDGGNLVVASGRRVTVYDNQLTEIESVLCSDDIACVRRTRDRLFVSTGKRIVEVERSGRETELVCDLWGDPNDVFAVDAATLWFAGAGPTVHAFDLARRVQTAHFALGNEWSGGSFALWPCRGGLIVAAPMDRKVAWVSLTGTPALREIVCDGHVIGAGDRALVTAGNRVDVRELPSGDVMASIQISEPPQSAARIGQDIFVFGNAGIHRIATDTVESVEYPDRGDRPLFHGAPFEDGIVLIAGDGELVVAEIQ